MPLIAYSPCGGNSAYTEWKLLICSSGLSLGKDSGDCCCDYSCLTNCPGAAPCELAPCEISYTSSANGGGTGSCSEGAYYLTRSDICNRSISMDINIVWNDGYPEQYNLHRFVKGNSIYSSSFDYCLYWVEEYGTIYGVDTCNSTYSDTYCCTKTYRWFRLFKLECATQEFIDVTDEAIASFDDNAFGGSWTQTSKGFYVYCYSMPPAGIVEDCDCCSAPTITIDDVDGPPTLVCAP